MIDDKFIKKHDALKTKTMKKMILPRGTSASKASAAMDPADAPET